MNFSVAEKIKAHFQEIITAGDIKTAMDRLSSIGHVTLVLRDGDGRPVLCTIERGSPCTLPGRIGKGDEPSTCDEEPLCSHARYQVAKGIFYRDHHVGALMGCVSERDGSGRAREILEHLGSLIREKIATEYAMNSLSEEILNKYEEINLQYELGEEMGAVFNTQEVCDIVLRKVLNVIGAEKASILLYDPGLKKLRIVSSKGIPREVVEETMIDDGEGICGSVFQSGKPLLVEDLDSLPMRWGHERRTYRTESFLSVPLMVSPLKVKTKTIGVINLADKPYHQFYHSGDLKLLSSISSQAALSIYTSMLIRELKENERIKKEMEIAEDIQKNLLPMRAPDVPVIDLAGRCIAAKKVGGDYYDFFHTPDKDRLGIVVADISGHSISAAIMMAITRGLLQSEALRNKSPAVLLADVNRLLFQDLVSSELFITMLYFSYRTKTRSLSFSNGGHPPPILLHAKSATPEFLESDGMGIGFLEAVNFEEKRIELCRGDLLVLYTDGIVEAENPHGHPFGMDRFLDILKKNRERTSADIIEESYQTVLKHVGQDDPHHGQEDDITLVVMKVL